MFEKLFAESGLSLERLKSFLEVASAGSIVKAAGGEPIRQSQYSRQIKELENFFRTRLMERQGKGARLTASGRELARISRFFMMGLSNFQRGCLAEEQKYRIGGSGTFIQRNLLPTLSKACKANTSFVTEVVADDEIERRLHDLTLDFGIMNRTGLSRPLQTKLLSRYQLMLCVPRGLYPGEAKALKAFHAQSLPLVHSRSEMAHFNHPLLAEYPARLVCESFAEAAKLLEEGTQAAVLPDHLAAALDEKTCLKIRLPKSWVAGGAYYLAWNPRLLRLNPHAVRQRDELIRRLTTG